MTKETARFLLSLIDTINIPAAHEDAPKTVADVQAAKTELTAILNEDEADQEAA